MSVSSPSNSMWKALYSSVVIVNDSRFECTKTWVSRYRYRLKIYRSRMKNDKTRQPKGWRQWGAVEPSVGIHGFYLLLRKAIPGLPARVPGRRWTTQLQSSSGRRKHESQYIQWGEPLSFLNPLYDEGSHNTVRHTHTQVLVTTIWGLGGVCEWVLTSECDLGWACHFVTRVILE